MRILKFKFLNLAFLCDYSWTVFCLFNWCPNLFVAAQNSFGPMGIRIHVHCTYHLKGDAMNLRLMFEVLGPLRLSFRIFCIKYAKKQRFQLFIWCKASFYSSIYIKVTGTNVKNRYFDFSWFCKKNHQNVAS